jgi:hypothetical protein
MTKRLLLLLTALITLLGCSSDDESVVVPPVDLFEAHGDFTNLLVGDGLVDTRMSVRLGPSLSVSDNIDPNRTRFFATLLLADVQETASIEVFLTSGDGATLNGGEQFPLRKDREYVFMAVGHVDSTQGTLKPTLIQLNPLASPGVSRVQFRFVHALAGAPFPVDVYVNGLQLTNVEYGSASAPVTFNRRPVSQDSLAVVSAGLTPDGSNEIWKANGTLLFLGESHYDAVLAHHPKSKFDGDVQGNALMIFIRDNTEDSQPGQY